MRIVYGVRNRKSPIIAISYIRFVVGPVLVLALHHKQIHMGERCILIRPPSVPQVIMT